MVVIIVGAVRIGVNIYLFGVVSDWCYNFLCWYRLISMAMVRFDVRADANAFNGIFSTVLSDANRAYATSDSRGLVSNITFAACAAHVALSHEEDEEDDDDVYDDDDDVDADEYANDDDDDDEHDSYDADL
jgi:hypothetical protein